MKIEAFWNRFQKGIEVAVASAASAKLLGVRDGFRRYFHDSLGASMPIVVVPHAEDEQLSGLCFTDEQTVDVARRRARQLADSLADAYQFYVASEGGLQSLELDGTTHYFVRNWTVVLGVVGESWGASGSVEIPGRLISGLEDGQIHTAVPGTRRGGGMISSLTGGMETRRTAVASATFHALSSAFYGILESGPRRRR